ncbi:hypothetical protein A245_24276, partial [Pseudomonas syringae pv. actinidiae ICMP 19096]
MLSIIRARHPDTKGTVSEISYKKCLLFFMQQIVATAKMFHGNATGTLFDFSQAFFIEARLISGNKFASNRASLHFADDHSRDNQRRAEQCDARQALTGQ